jgi:hypothetical protein
MIATGLTKKVPELEIPIYFFGGIYDYACSYTLAKDYLEKLTVNCAFFEEEKHMSQKKVFHADEWYYPTPTEDSLPFLGQTPPGNTPVIFAEGVISKGNVHGQLVISPNGNRNAIGLGQSCRTRPGESVRCQSSAALRAGLDAFVGRAN